MPIDPVCGMAVAKGTAASTVAHEGETYDFCSTGCAVSVLRRAAQPDDRRSGDELQFRVGHRQRAATALGALTCS